MLSRERSVRRVLGRGGRTDCHRRTVTQRIVRGADLRSGPELKVVFVKQLPDALRRFLERNYTLDNFGPRKGQNPCFEAVGLDESSIGERGDQESARHVEARIGQERQGSTLATHDFQGVAGAIESYDMH